MLTFNPLKPKTCRNAECRAKFTPVRPMQVACGLECARVIGRAQAEKKAKEAAKAERMADNVKRASLKPLRALKMEAQRAFNSYIRERDRQAGHPCISSGRKLDWSGNGVDAGHYRSVGAASHLRFDERNCHAQSKHDNQYKSGNAADYRIGLIKRIGLAAVEALEADNVPHKWSRQELIAVKQLYVAKLRELMKEST